MTTHASNCWLLYFNERSGTILNKERRKKALSNHAPILSHLLARNAYYIDRLFSFLLYWLFNFESASHKGGVRETSPTTMLRHNLQRAHVWIERMLPLLSNFLLLCTSASFMSTSSLKITFSCIEYSIWGDVIWNRTMQFSLATTRLV